MKSFKAVLFSLFFYLVSPTIYADIKVGTVIFQPPFVMSATQGFDVDFIRILCQRMNAGYQLMPMDRDKLSMALDTGNIDIAIAGIVISKSKEDKYIFSLPYMLSKGQFFILKQSSMQSVSDLQGQKVGVLKGQEDGGVFFDYLNTNYMGQFQTISFEDLEDILTALTNKKITAAFVHESTALYWEQNGGGQFRTLGEPSLVGDGIAIMALPKNNDLIQQINQQIEAMEKDGTFLSLYQLYFANEI